MRATLAAAYKARQAREAAARVAAAYAPWSYCTEGLACIGTPTNLDKLGKGHNGCRVSANAMARLPGRAPHIIVKKRRRADACALAKRKQSTRLMLILASGDQLTVQEVLTAGSVHLCSHMAFSPLATAIRLGQPAIVAELLQSGADPNDCRYQAEARYPLHMAAQFKDVQCCKLLLEHGADPNAADGENRRALHDAVSNEDRPAELSADEQVSFATVRSDSKLQDSSTCGILWPISTCAHA